jgi:hypothetical protein
MVMDGFTMAFIPRSQPSLDCHPRSNTTGIAEFLISDGSPTQLALFFLVKVTKQGWNCDKDAARR